MSQTSPRHRRQISIKIPPDIDTKLQKSIESGEFTNTSEAIMTGLRFYYQFYEIDDFRKTVIMLQNNQKILDMRCEFLEKILCELELKNNR